MATDLKAGDCVASVQGHYGEIIGVGISRQTNLILYLCEGISGGEVFHFVGTSKALSKITPAYRDWDAGMRAPTTQNGSTR